MISRIRLYLAFMVAAGATAALMPVQIAAIKLRSPVARKLPVFWHRIVCRTIGIRVNCRGAPSRLQPLMIVANHVSWSDILILGSLFPLSFIAKDEVSRTPGANLLARLQRTVFVVRENRQQAGQQAREVTDRLLAGDVMVLFAEGTTGGGNRLQEFKSSLFGAAQYAVRDGGLDAVHIQPVAIRYSHLHGIPLDRGGSRKATWIGDEDLGPHLAEFVRLGAWDVEVSFAEPVPFTSTTRRKDMAVHCRTEIRKMLGERVDREG